MPYCFENFSGLATKSDNLLAGFASVAENVDLTCGRLDPWRTPLLIGEVPENAESIFYKNGKFRYSPNKGVTVVHSISGLEFSSDPCDCLYFRKDWCEPEKRALGLPRPPEPTITGLSPPPTDEDCWTPELTTVKITFQSRCGHYKYESQPSVVSNQIKCKIDDEIQVDIPAFNDDKFIIDTVCVYVSQTTWDVSQGLHGYPTLGTNSQGRTAEGTDSNFETNVDVGCYKIAEIPFVAGGQSFVITKDKCLGELLTTVGWAAPEPGLCLAGESNTGSLVAYDEYCVRFSVRNSPHAWRFADIMSFGSRIRFACHKNLFTYVFTEDCTLYIITDDNDCTVKGSCRSVQRVCDVPLPCISKFNANKATLCGNYGVIYPADSGLIHIAPDGTITNRLPTDKRDFIWQNDISLAFYEDKVFINGFEKAYIMTLPLRAGYPQDRPTTLSTYSQCVKCWVEQCGRLFMLDFDGKVYEWDKGDKCLHIRYRQNRTRIQGVNLTTMSVEYDGDHANCSTFTLLKDDKKHQVKTIRDCEALRITRLNNAKSFTWQYDGTDSVERVCFGTSRQDLGVAAA